MKHLKFLAALCCMLAVFTACEKNEPLDNTNGNGINTDQNGGSSNTDSSSGSVSAPTGSENGHGYVDLGLPSGTKWATCNVGATKPEEYGNYYAWGETTPKDDYDWSTYKYGSDYDELTKYCTDSDYGKDGFADYKTVLDPEDDAARANWGGAWRMPTKEECEELLDNCTLKWVYSYKGTGVAGLIVTSNINGNSIFLPAAGYRYGGDLDGAGDCGYYRSSSLYTGGPDVAWQLVGFYSDDVFGGSNYRFFGHSVRPVLGE
ncbi:MAG: hypothetical protein ACI30B_08415 [Paludibacteraceae bacterium]